MSNRNERTHRSVLRRAVQLLAGDLLRTQWVRVRPGRGEYVLSIGNVTARQDKGVADLALKAVHHAYQDLSEDPVQHATVRRNGVLHVGTAQCVSA